MSFPINWDTFWSLTGETLELAAFTAIQLSMVVFLVRKGRRDPVFREAFYILFVAVTIVDCAAVIVVRAFLQLFKQGCGYPVQISVDKSFKMT